MEEDRIYSELKRYFGFTSFRPLQKEIVTAVLGGHDVVVLMPTGGGKSICYQLPAMMMDGVTIVISPLISLMKDQVDNLIASGIPAAAYNSTISFSELNAIERRCRNKEIRLLYMSPETALSLKDSWLSHIPIALFAIDEAHCISQWGPDFRPEYSRLAQLREAFPHVPLLGLTATADKVTRKDIIRQLKMRDPSVFIASFHRPNLHLSVVKGLKKREKDQMIHTFLALHPHQSGIIYCLSRNTTDKVAAMLRLMGHSAAAYHAGMLPDERQQVQEAFVNDRISIVCATVAFGMGIDKSNVRWVIHYNMPSSLEAYYQEIGRSGRDGLPAETILFYSYSDVVQWGKMAAQSSQRDMLTKRLESMQQYAEASICRTRILLNYFGEPYDGHCGHCDVCRSQPQEFDGTIVAQKLFSAIVRTGEKYGLFPIIDVLMGRYSPVVKRDRLDTIRTFGVGRDCTWSQWQDYALQLLQMGYLEIVYDESNRLVVTGMGRRVLLEGEKVRLVVLQQKEEEKVVRQRRRKQALPVMPGWEASLEEDLTLFQHLKTLRMQLARAKKVPPYVIFSDKVLHDISRLQPTTLEAFGQLPGVGEYKCSHYGSDFVQLVCEYKEGCKG